MGELSMLKINNSKNAAIDKGKWKDPGAKLYDTLMDAFYSKGDIPIGSKELDKAMKDGTYYMYDEFLKEAYMVAPVADIKNSPYGRTPFSRSGCKYPHHVIKGKELVVSIPGLKAAYICARNQGVLINHTQENKKIVAHFNKHFRELGIKPLWHHGQLYFENDTTKKITEKFDFSGIDTVIFDIGSVLSEPQDGRELIKKKYHDKFNETQIDCFVKSYYDKLEDYETASILNAKKLYKSFLTDDIKEYADDVFEILALSGDAYDYTDDMIKYLKDKGYKLYYLSNWHKSGFELMKQKGKFKYLDQFDGGLVSYDAGCQKPDPKIYQLLIDKFKLDPNSCIFFDDRKENIEAAKKIGFKAEQFHPSTVKEINNMKPDKAYNERIEENFDIIFEHLYDREGINLYNGKFESPISTIKENTLLESVMNNEALVLNSEHLNEIGHTPEEIYEWMHKNIAYDDTITGWKLRLPSEVYEDRKGNCHDQALFEAFIFHTNGIINGQLFFVEFSKDKKEGGNTHTLTWFRKAAREAKLSADWKAPFEEENAAKGPFTYYWFENAWEDQAGIHGPYNSIDEIKEAVLEVYNTDSDINSHQYDGIVFGKYSNYRCGMNLNEYVSSWRLDDDRLFTKDEKFYRVTHNGIGIYQALRQQVSKDRWKELLQSEAFTWLPKPKDYPPGHISYFTKKGIQKFNELTLPIVTAVIGDNVKIEEVKGIKNIVYYDEYQVIADMSLLVNESINWINEFIYNDIFQESVSINNIKDFNSKIKTPEELMEWMDCIQYGWFDKSKNINGTGENDSTEKLCNEYKLQSPLQLLRSKVGLCWDQVELERLWFDKHNIPHAVIFVEADDGEDKPTHTFLIFKEPGESGEVYWFDHAWREIGIKKYKDLSSCLKEAVKKTVASFNTKADEIIVRKLCHPMRPGMKCEAYYKVAEAEFPIDLADLQYDDVFNERVWMSNGPYINHYIEELAKASHLTVAAKSWRTEILCERVKPTLKTFEESDILNMSIISNPFYEAEDNDAPPEIIGEDDPDNSTSTSKDVDVPPPELEETPIEDESIDDSVTSTTVQKGDKKEDAASDTTSIVNKDNEGNDETSNEKEVEEKEPPKEEKKESLPKQADKAESDKNGVRRKKLYIAFIEWCKEYNERNTFGSIFDKDAFHSSYPFVPHEMRYFYRLANPMLCVLAGDLTFFQVAELRKLNSTNKKMNELLIFAATPTDLRVFNIKDKKVYRAEDNNGEVVLKETLSDTFDTYIQMMIQKGDILNGPIEDTDKSEE